MSADDGIPRSNFSYSSQNVQLQGDGVTLTGSLTDMNGNSNDTQVDISQFSMWAHEGCAQTRC